MPDALVLALRFALFAALQVLVFNAEALTLFDLATAQAYVLYILLLPMALRTPVVYLLAFGLGLLVNLFSHQLLGAHAAAALLVAALRGPWATVITPQGGYGRAARAGDELELSRQNLAWMLSYLLPLIFVFTLAHTALADLSLGWRTWLKILAGTAYTGAMCLVLLILFFRRG